MFKIILALVPILAWSQTSVEPKKDTSGWEVKFNAEGYMGPKTDFKLLGRNMVASADSLLSSHGGFDKLYTKFETTDSTAKLSYGVWQKASAFQKHLADCGIEISTEALAMKIGLNAVFATKTDAEVNQILDELGPKLTDQNRIAFISQLGGSLLSRYDYARTNQSDDRSKGIVTPRDMIEAAQNNSKSGVCRDMAVFMAQTATRLGLKKTEVGYKEELKAFVVAYSTDGGGHATVLIQDAKNPNKTNTVNYAYVTSTEGTSPLKHLLQDNTLPSVGTSYRVFDSNGKYLIELPSNLGVLLHEMGGGKASQLDPMLRSENSFASIGLANPKEGLSVNLAKGVSADGDSVNAIAANMTDNSETMPMWATGVLYQSTRDTALKGKMTTLGGYIAAEQVIQHKPFVLEMADGKLDAQAFMSFGIQLNIADVKTEISDSKGISMDSTVKGSVGGKVNYQSNDEKSKVHAIVVATGAMTKKDVRDEGSTTFDLRDITGSVGTSQEIASGVHGITNITTTIRRSDLGIQSRQEAGLNFKVLDGNGQVVVGHEGQIKGRSLAFVPGSTQRVYAEASYRDRYDNDISGGLFCTVQGTKDCGVRIKGTYKFPVKKR